MLGFTVTTSPSGNARTERPVLRIASQTAEYSNRLPLMLGCRMHPTGHSVQYKYSAARQKLVRSSVNDMQSTATRSGEAIFSGSKRPFCRSITDLDLTPPRLMDEPFNFYPLSGCKTLDLGAVVRNRHRLIGQAVIRSQPPAQAVCADLDFCLKSAA
jgi:hypothetical protein